MASAIDASKPADGVAAAKADLRANLAAARDEINHGGFFTPAGSGGIERTTLARLAELPRMTDYGAGPAGLASALNAHDIVVIPPGTYDFSAAQDYTGYSGKTIIGTGATLTPDSRVDFINCSDLILHGLAFGDANGAAEALGIQDCTDVRIDDCRFTGFANNALRLHGSNTRLAVVRSWFKDNGTIDTAPASTDYLTKGAGIYMPAGASCDTLEIDRNEIRGSGGHGINLVIDGGTLDHLVCRMNRIIDAGLGAIIVGGADGIGHAQILSNKVKGAGDGLTTGSATLCHGIYVPLATDPALVTIEANFISRTEDAGIVAAAVIKGNQIHTTGENIANLGSSRGGSSPSPTAIRIHGGSAYANFCYLIGHQAVDIRASDVTVQRTIVHGWNTAGGSNRNGIVNNNSGTLSKVVIEGNVLYGIAQVAGDRSINITGTVSATTVAQHNHSYDCTKAAIAASGVAYRNRTDGVLD